VFEHVPDDPTSLPSSLISVLFEDSSQQLWIGTTWNGGLTLYDNTTERFKRMPRKPDSGGIRGSNVRAIVEDHEGVLWIGTELALNWFDPHTYTSRSFGFSPQVLDNGNPPPIRALEVDHDNQVWVGTEKGLFVFDRTSQELLPWQGFGPDAATVSTAAVWDLLEDTSDAFWVATMGSGLFRLEPQTRQATAFVPSEADPTSLSHLRVRCLAEDRGGLIWIGTENGGLNTLDPTTGEFRHYLPDITNPHSLSSASIWTLLVDDRDMVWLGTYNSGLNFVIPFGRVFDHITAHANGLPDPHVASVLEDTDGTLWVGTDGGGLHRFDGRTGDITSYRHDPEDSSSIGSDAVLTLFEDSRGTLWLGGWGAGLCRFDKRTARVTRYLHDSADSQPLSANDVWRIASIPTGELVVASQAGVDLFDPAGEEFTRLADRYPGAGEPSTVAIATDHEHNLWLAGAEYAQYINLTTGEVTTYHHDPENPSSLGRGWVVAVLVDSRGNVWLGTESGLNCLSAQTREMRRFTEADGVRWRSVSNILEDDSGNIWISSAEGLCRLTGAVAQPDRLDVLSFDQRDGLQGQGFTRGAAFHSPTGRFYLGGPDGLTCFSPDMIRRNPYPPPVVLTDLKIGGTSLVPGTDDDVLPQSITQTDALTLSYRHTVIRFEFAALNYFIPQKNLFQYQLDGFDKSWSAPSSQHQATYTNLPDGHYVFRVRAANNDGVWNEGGIALQLKVTPPYYKSLWFRICTVLLIMLVPVLGYRRRVQRIKARSRLLADEVAARTTELAQLNEELERRVTHRTAELEAEKERLAITLRSIGEGVIATDMVGKVILMNAVAENLTGWSQAEATGHDLEEVFQARDPKTRQAQPDPAQTVLANEPSLTPLAEGLLISRGGNEALVAATTAPIRDHTESIIGVVVVFRDITGRRKLEQQLQNAEKLEALGILAGGIAHDFNNLLTGIFGQIDVASHTSNPAKARDNLTKAVSVLNKARSLTGQLMTFSRAGQPVKTPLGLANILHNSVRFALSGSNVNAEMQVADNLWPCEGDEGQINQVIDNLVLNARQAMPDGGTITVTADNVHVPDEVKLPIAAGRYVRVRIGDQGPGIPASHRSRIFEPFFTTKATGTGLGLATTYSIIQKHSGYIDVESDTGAGTSFAIYLPASADAASAQQEQPRDQQPPRARILVLDDDEGVRETMNDILQLLECDTVITATGEEAIAAFSRARDAEAPFDLAILDLTLPGGMNGIEVLSRLRQIDPSTKAVVSSGYSGDPAMADPHAHGFIDRLTKPYTISELSSLLTRLLS